MCYIFQKIRVHLQNTGMAYGIGDIHVVCKTVIEIGQKVDVLSKAFF